MLCMLMTMVDSPEDKRKLKNCMKNIELYDAMKRLPKKYSSVLILYYINGFSSKEIADFFYLSEYAVHKRLSRARKKLGEELKSND